MTTLIEAAKLALEALERYAPQHGNPDDMIDAIAALRTAIAEAEKPVAWVNKDDLGKFDMRVRTNCDYYHTMPLYTTPPAAQTAQRQPLTKEQLLRLCGPQSYGPYNHKIISFARAIEAAHGIKETNT